MKLFSALRKTHLSLTFYTSESDLTWIYEITEIGVVLVVHTQYHEQSMQMTEHQTKFNLIQG